VTSVKLDPLTLCVADTGPRLHLINGGVRALCGNAIDRLDLYEHGGWEVWEEEPGRRCKLCERIGATDG